MAPVRLGLIGCGRVAQRIHVRALRTLRDAAVMAVAEPDEARREEACRRLGGAAGFASHENLLARADVDAVVICTPPATHAAIAVEALGAGKHVYVEKPGATSADEASAVVEAWHDAGCVATVGLNFRLHPLFAALRQEVAGGSIGDVVALRGVFCAASRELPRWKRQRGLGGGVLLDLVIHHVDLARFILDDEVMDVSASVRSVHTEADTATVHLRMAGGALVQLFCSMTAVERDGIEVYGTNGGLVADRRRSSRLARLPVRVPAGARRRAESLWRELGAFPRALADRLGAVREDSHRRALQAFVDAVRTDDPALVPTPEDAYRTLAVVLAAEASAREEGAIHLDFGIDTALVT